jgi:uncharacterized membrane protein
MIDPSIWSKLHGAFTHFPVALMLVSVFCEIAARLLPRREWQNHLHATASVTLVLGAIGSYAAVFTGLVTAKWQPWGHATLLRHHQFVWPAFALMTGLATWRILGRPNLSRTSSAAYLALMCLAAVLIAIAAYWGGEMLSQG